MSFVYRSEFDPIAALSLLLAGTPTMLFSIASYVLTAMALYTIARRRGLYNPWLAWVPIGKEWLLGSISDQYRYVVRGQVKSKRKWLLGLSAALAVLTVWIAVSILLMISDATPDRVFVLLAKLLMLILAVGLPMAIARTVLRYMALYDGFQSLDPDNGVLFTVLSILFSPTEPFFLFFNRMKDGGMPPRKGQTPPEQPQPTDYHYEMGQ